MSRTMPMMAIIGGIGFSDIWKLPTFPFLFLYYFDYVFPCKCKLDVLTVICLAMFTPNAIWFKVDLSYEFSVWIGFV